MMAISRLIGVAELKDAPAAREQQWQFDLDGRGSAARRLSRHDRGLAENRQGHRRRSQNRLDCVASLFSAC